MNKMFYYKGLALADINIDFYGLKIRQPKVREVLEMGDEQFFKLFKPFLFGDDLVTMEGLPIKISILDYSISIPSDNGFLLADIIESIKFFCCLKDNDITLDIKDEDRIEGVSKELGLKRINIIVGDTVINSDNYDELRKIILLICGDRQPLTKEDLNKKEEELKCANEKDNDRLAKLLKGRKKERAKQKKSDDIKSMTLNIYNTVVHMDNFIDYDKVLNWNFYRLINTYLTLQKKEFYNFDRDIKSSGMVNLEGVEIPDLTKIILIEENQV